MIDLIASYINRIKSWLKSQWLVITISLFITIGTFIVLWPAVVIRIPVGNVGVIFRPLQNGINLNEIIEEGLHIVWPWNSVTAYSIQTQLQKIDIDLITLDLLKTRATVSFQYEIDPKTVTYLHKFVGPNYLEKIVLPEIIQITRASVGKLNSHDAYTSALESLSATIQENANQSIINNFQPAGLLKLHLIHIDSIQITGISFPKEVEQAIEAKIVEQTKADGMEYVITSAKKEAERKQIEAEGIRAFQDTIKGGLNENYLRYVGIMTSEKLASSNNAKIVVFGSGQSGLPLIFDDFDKNSSAKNQATRPGSKQ
jgi:regulator of protease activity HflC (stomatin/prohibitin superfamily)